MEAFAIDRVDFAMRRSASSTGRCLPRSADRGRAHAERRGCRRTGWRRRSRSDGSAAASPRRRGRDCSTGRGSCRPPCASACIPEGSVPPAASSRSAAANTVLPASTSRKVTGRPLWGGRLRFHVSRRSCVFRQGAIHGPPCLLSCGEGLDVGEDVCPVLLLGKAWECHLVAGNLLLGVGYVFEDLIVGPDQTRLHPRRSSPSNSRRCPWRETQAEFRRSVRSTLFRLGPIGFFVSPMPWQTPHFANTFLPASALPSSAAGRRRKKGEDPAKLQKFHQTSHCNSSINRLLSARGKVVRAAIVSRRVT